MTAKQYVLLIIIGSLITQNTFCILDTINGTVNDLGPATLCIPNLMAIISNWGMHNV